MLGQQDIFESITPKQTGLSGTLFVMLCDPWKSSVISVFLNVKATNAENIFSHIVHTLQMPQSLAVILLLVEGIPVAITDAARCTSSPQSPKNLEVRVSLITARRVSQPFKVLPGFDFHKATVTVLIWENSGRTGLDLQALRTKQNQ